MPSIPAALALRFVSRKETNSISSLDDEEERRFKNNLDDNTRYNHHDNNNTSSSPENDSSSASSATSSYCPLLTSPSCVHYGYLFKRGLKNKKWQKRFFLLYADGFMLYYKSQQDIILNSEHPRGVIYLKPQKQVFISKQSSDVPNSKTSNNTLDEENSNSNNSNNHSSSSLHGFVLTVCSRRYSLACEYEQDKNEWIEKITMVAYNADNASSVIANQYSNVTSTSPPTTLPSANMNSNHTTTNALSSSSNTHIAQSRRRLYGDAERVSESVDQLEREGIFKVLQGIERLENLMKLLNNERNNEELDSVFSSRTLTDHSQLPYYCNNFSHQSQQHTTNPYSNYEDQNATVIDINSHPTERLQVLNEYLLNQSSQRLKEVYRFMQSNKSNNTHSETTTKNGRCEEQPHNKTLEEENEKLKAKIRQLTLDNQQLQDKNDEFTKHKQLLVKEVKKLRGIIKECGSSNTTDSNHHPTIDVTKNHGRTFARSDNETDRNNSTSSNSSTDED